MKHRKRYHTFVLKRNYIY